MRKIFIILFLMLSIFTVINAHPFKTEKELQDFYAKIDKEVDKELKKDYIKLFEQRKANLKEKASNNDTKKMLEDNEYLFVFKNGKLEKVFKKDILDGKFIILSYMYENGKKEKIVCLNKENSHYYGTVKGFGEDGIPLYSGQFYAGKMEGIYKEYYESGKIFKEINFINDKENGQGKIYYEDGKILRIVNLKNGKENGEAKSYDENGKLNGRTIFKDNIKLEEDVYKENEILKNTFKNGELVKQDICTLNGTLKERRILNGDEMEYSTFYPNGNVKQKILAKDKIIIKEQIYARNGNIMSNSFFSDGKPVTEYFEYYPDGKLFRKISTINKMLNGDSIEYYPNGNIKEKVFFADNKMNGEAIKYYENGVVKEKAYFINDKQEKENFFYDEKGKLIKTEIYKNDVKQ